MNHETFRTVLQMKKESTDDIHVRNEINQLLTMLMLPEIIEDQTFRDRVRAIMRGEKHPSRVDCVETSHS